MKTRTELINKLIQERGYKSYIEIGFQNGVNFDAIICNHKYAIEPLPVKNISVFNGTSDEFFKTFHDIKADCYFIDGLHEAAQVERDILNGMKHLNEGGCLVVHDVLPTSEETQRVPRVTKEWYGDVWRAVHGFKNKYGNTVIHDFDCGIAVIEKTDCEPGFTDYLTTFDEYKKLPI